MELPVLNFGQEEEKDTPLEKREQSEVTAKRPAGHAPAESRESKTALPIPFRPLLYTGGNLEKTIQTNQEQIRQQTTEKLRAKLYEATHPELPEATQVTKPMPEIQKQIRPEAFVLSPIAEAKTREKLPELPKEPVKLPAVEQLTTPELLQIAKNITVEGMKASALYEANQIDHSGLVAIVQESLKGGNVKKAFKKHRLGVEAQRGRKIEMRHDDPSKTPHVITTYDQPSYTVRAITEQLQPKTAPTQADGLKQTPEKFNHSPIPADEKPQKAASKNNSVIIALSTMLAIGIGAGLAILFG